MYDIVWFEKYKEAEALEEVERLTDLEIKLRHLEEMAGLKIWLDHCPLPDAVGRPMQTRGSCVMRNFLGSSSVQPGAFQIPTNLLRDKRWLDLEVRPGLVGGKLNERFLQSAEFAKAREIDVTMDRNRIAALKAAEITRWETQVWHASHIAETILAWPARFIFGKLRWMVGLIPWESLAIVLGMVLSFVSWIGMAVCLVVFSLPAWMLAWIPRWLRSRRQARALREAVPMLAARNAYKLMVRRKEKTVQMGT